MNDKRLIAFERLLNIMDKVRVNCPWDKKQTFESLRYLTIEETYELSDAIIDKKYDDVAKELGDLMLHIVFYSKIAEEKNLFSITDVLKGINEKLIRRHPHIFGDVKVSSSEEVKENWEQIKLKEGNRSVLGGIPTSLPAMVKALRIQEKAQGIGFDWENTEQVLEKVKEEITEFCVEKEKKSEQMEDEFGDLLFALINFARFIDINPEDALEKTNHKFIKRFQHMEKRTKELNKQMADMSLNELEELWQEAKRDIEN